jgi:hypothetical protein
MRGAPPFAAVLLLSYCTLSAAHLSHDQIKAAILSNYDKSTRPAKAKGAGTNSSCNAATPDVVTTQFIIDYLRVDQKETSYTLSGFFRVYWNDWRLAFNATDACSEAIIFDDLSGFWTPDLFFEEARAINLGGGGFGQMFKLSADGSVYWSRQATVTLTCKMFFGNIPFDTQTCHYLVGEYSQTAEDVLVQWSTPPGEQLALANWQNASTTRWTVTDMVQENVFKTYTLRYSYAQATLFLKRRAQEYLLEYMLLAILTVLMAYSGFFIPPAAVPARVGLSVITTLVVSNLLASARNHLPPFGYSTWLTDLMFVSFLFDLLAFLEVAAVCFGRTLDEQHAKRAKIEPAAIRVDLAATASNDSLVEHGKQEEFFLSRPTRRFSKFTRDGLLGRLRAMKDLDVTMRWFFPAAYALFLIIMATQIGKYNTQGDLL